MKEKELQLKKKELELKEKVLKISQVEPHRNEISKKINQISQKKLTYFKLAYFSGSVDFSVATDNKNYDILDAKRVSQQLNIDHRILYYQKKFKKDVIASFIESYVAGETPIPCVQCNQTVKFKDLYQEAKKLKTMQLWERSFLQHCLEIKKNTKK